MYPVRSFAHFKGLCDLVYQHDYDLLQAPNALKKVFKHW